MNSNIQEIHVLLPECLTVESGHLVWSRDVPKGSLVQLQEGEIRQIKVDVSKIKEITAVSFLLFCYFLDFVSFFLRLFMFGC